MAKKAKHPEVNRRLRAIRDMLHMKQADFAALIDIDQSSYSRIENGYNYLSTPTIYSLIFNIKVKPDYLFFGKGEMFELDGDGMMGTESHAYVRMEDKAKYTLLTIKVPKKGGSGDEG